LSDSISQDVRAQIEEERGAQLIDDFNFCSVSTVVVAESYGK